MRDHKIISLCLGALLLAGCGSSQPPELGTLPTVPGDAAGPRVVDGNPAEWIGSPSYIGGISRYSQGEFIHSDFVHDDSGADFENVKPGFPFSTALRRLQRTGDFGYPPAGTATDTIHRYDDVADLLELRIAADPQTLHYLIRLGAMRQPDTAVIGIGVDADRNPATGAAAWPRGARTAQALGYEYFLTLWGSDGEWTDYTVNPPVTTAVSVAANPELNLIEASVPRPPNTQNAIWRHYAGSGRWDGTAWAAPAPYSRGGNLPAPPTVPLIYDLAFQGIEANHVWRDKLQGDQLAANDIAPFFADVELALLDRKATTHPQPVGALNIQYPADPYGPGEGVSYNNTSTLFHGPVQPYSLYLPTAYWTDPKPRRFHWFFHCAGCNHNIWAAGVEATDAETSTELDPVRGYAHSQSLIDSGDMVIAGLLQLGDPGGGNNPAPQGGFLEERDILNVKRAIEQREQVSIDQRRVVFSGMSNGGLTTFWMTARYPHWVRAMNTYSYIGSDEPVNWQSYRNVFVTVVTGNTELDGLSPILGRQFAANLTAAGYEHFYMEMQGRRHEFQMVGETWPIIRGLDEPYLLDDNPARVTFVLDPAYEAPELGLTHTEAYWLSGLVLADATVKGNADIFANPLAHKLPTQATQLNGHFVNSTTGDLALVSWLQYQNLEGRSIGEFDPAWTPFVDLTFSDVSANLQFPQQPGSNGFEAMLINLSAASLNLPRMGIDARQLIIGTLQNSALITLRLQAPFTGREQLRVNGQPASACFAGDALLIELPAGSNQISIQP
ncbi:MAG: hypothetical protein V4650_01480 [Pseudomonadota bacterium]